MRDKKIFFIAMAASVLILSVYLFTAIGQKNDSGYIITPHGRSFAAFIEGSSEPVYIFETLLDELPEKDRKSIENGLSVKNSDELDRLIEDFDG